MSTSPVDRTTRWLVLGALGWTLLAGGFWALAPSGSSSSTTATSTGVVTTTSSHESLLEANGQSVLIVLAVPVAIALIAAFALQTRHQRAIVMACGFTLVVGCVLGMLTIGLSYVPAAALLLIAATRSAPARA